MSATLSFLVHTLVFILVFNHRAFVIATWAHRYLVTTVALPEMLHEYKWTIGD